MKIKKIEKSLAYKRARKVMDLRVALAMEIYDARSLRSWSQQELSKRAETSQKIISKLECGDIDVGFDLLCRIIDALNLNFEIGKTKLLDGSSQLIFDVTLPDESDYLSINAQASAEHTVQKIKINK